MKIITEDSIQQQCVIHFNNTYCLKNHDPKGVVFSVPNEGAQRMGRTVLMQFKKIGIHNTVVKTVENTLGIVSKTLTAMGLNKGVSDLICILPNGNILFCELKTATGLQRKEQIEFQKRVSDLGFEYILIRSLEQFKKECSERIRVSE